MCGPQHIRHQFLDRPMLRFSVRCKCAAHNMPKNIVFPSANYRSNVIYIQKRIIAERRPTTTIVKLFLKRFNAKTIIDITRCSMLSVWTRVLNRWVRACPLREAWPRLRNADGLRHLSSLYCPTATTAALLCHCRCLPDASSAQLSACSSRSVDQFLTTLHESRKVCVRARNVTKCACVRGHVHVRGGMCMCAGVCAYARGGLAVSPTTRKQRNMSLLKNACKRMT